MLYFGQKRSGLFHVDHTNQSLMPCSQKNKCIFLLQHLAAACCCSPRKSPIIYGGAAARNQPGHFGNCSGAVCPAHHLWFFWFILACLEAVEEEAFSLYLLCSSTARAASGPYCHNRLASSARNLHPFFSLARLISLIVFIFFPIQHFFLVQNNWFLGDLWVYWRSGYEADYEMAWKFYRDFSPAETLLGAMLTCLTATTRSMPTDSLPLINCGDKAKLLVPHSCTAWPPRSLKAQRDASLQQIRIYPPHTAPAKTHLRLSWAQTASTRCVWESTCSEQLKTPLTEVEILTSK